MDIEKLRHVLEHVLPKISDEDFNMEAYVSKEEKECGTVCCIAGWFPKHWPESGFTWFRRGYLLTLRAPAPYTQPELALRALFGCESEAENLVVSRLFGLHSAKETFGSRNPSIGKVRRIWAETLRDMEAGGAEHALSRLCGHRK